MQQNAFSLLHQRPSISGHALCLNTPAFSWNSGFVNAHLCGIYLHVGVYLHITFVISKLLLPVLEQLSSLLGLV